MWTLRDIYDLYLNAKKLLNLDISESRNMPFYFLLNLVLSEIERLKAEIEEAQKTPVSEKPVEEEIPASVLKDIERRIKGQ